MPVPRVCLGRDIGFNVRPLELRGASVPSLDISAASYASARSLRR